MKIVYRRREGRSATATKELGWSRGTLRLQWVTWVCGGGWQRE
ncbi:hypothetical protein SLEP1_g41350 [Rubroshorea leprosula]|uniref:Transposase n=1 Tax=Rubroshorea leprosula TaxID=152421 RepID=A0AAV5L6B8_9ROSI|nr:hypothetical protein SLEP1_g41350 [Rubroshorea leprosula]